MPMMLPSEAIGAMEEGTSYNPYVNQPNYVSNLQYCSDAGGVGVNIEENDMTLDEYISSKFGSDGQQQQTKSSAV